LIVDASGLSRENVFVQQGTQQLVWAGGPIASVRFAVPLGPVQLSVGPFVEWLVRPIIVQVADVEVFRMPAFLAGFSIDADIALGD
jgi:hypothetical protein